MPTIYSAESFDWPGTTTDRPGSSVSAFSQQPGRISGKCVQAAVNNGDGLNNYIHPFPAAYSSACVGVSFTTSAAPVAVIFRILTVRNSTAAHLGIYLNANMSLSVSRDTTVLGTSSPSVVVAGGWHRIELKFTIDDSAGSYELRVDGATVLSGSGADTRNGATTGADRVYLQNGHNTSGGIWKFDDLTVSDDFLGDLHIEQLLPTSDTSVAWTRSTGATNFSCVDEAQVSTTDYVTAATAGLVDRYGLSGLSNTPQTIHAVQTIFHGSKDNTGACSIRANIVAGASTTTGTTRTMNTSNLLYVELHQTKPGGGAWTGAPTAIEIERAA